MGRDLSATIVYGDLEVTITAEGVSWSGEVASDLMARVLAGFGAALTLIQVQPQEDDA